MVRASPAAFAQQREAVMLLAVVVRKITPWFACLTLFGERFHRGERHAINIAQ
jgi:hypothetical protein